MIKKISILIFLFAISLDVLSQDTTRYQELDEVNIEKQRLFQRQGLYDYYEKDLTASINGFTQLTIFENQMSDEVWSTEGRECVDLTINQDTKDTYLKLKWNKDQESCDWVGIGFGWDFWSSKDMGQILACAAIEMEIRSKDKVLTNLPWAFCLEDYAGGQAWTGFNKSFAPEGQISKEWTKVIIPLSAFPFEAFDCDPGNIKQLMIQLFAQDAVEINAIRIVPFKEKMKQEMISIKTNKYTVEVDGDLNDWDNSFMELDGQHSFSVRNSLDSMYIGVKVKDSHPRINDQIKGNLWNGDAIEIAFSTNPKADPKRKLFLLSDYHIGINCGNEPYFWNFSEDKPFDKGSFAIRNTPNGYDIEIGIALSDLTNGRSMTNQTLGFEIAIDDGNESNKRQEQFRWNSKENEGFHQNPSLWGKLILN